MTARRPLFACLATLAGCLGVAGLQDGPRDRGEAALRAGDYPAAALRFAEALGAAKEGQDELLYLLAVAQARAGKPDDALAALDRLLGEFPASSLRAKAAFRRADVLAAKKDFAAAAAIYDERLAGLVDPERRRRIARVYLDVAREYLVPKDPKDATFKPDFAVARGLLVKALDLEAGGPDEEGARADVVRCEAAGAGKPEELLASCTAFEAKFPKSAALDEVLFARGDALAKLERRREAERTWTRLADAFPASKRAPEGLLRAAGLYVGQPWAHPVRHPLPLLRRIAKEFPQSESAPTALKQAGDVLAVRPGLGAEAREAWRDLATKHPKHALAPAALVEIARSHAQEDDDAAAIAVYEELLKGYPESPRWHEGRQGIPDLRFRRVERAWALGDFPGVRKAAQEFLDAHPGDPRASRAAHSSAESLAKEKKFPEAVAALLAVAARYPDDRALESRASAGRLLATELGDFDRAIQELTLAKASGAEFLDELREPGLHLSTERSFRSGEAPAARLRVRNLEKVKLRLWAVDVRDYFEKKGRTAGLESLEVSVIAPDHEWEFAVPNHVRHKEFELPIEVPRKEPGAYVVVASAGALEAKTVVVVTDLGLLVRAGPRGAEWVVQDLKTGARVADAAVRFAVDGKHLKAFAADTRAKTVSLLAESKGHLAFADVEVGNLPVPSDLKPAALILPERRLVAPGETATVRVAVRDPENGVYRAPPAAKKYRLEAAGEAGPVFFETDLAFSKSGLATAFVRLPLGVTRAELRVFERAKPQDLLAGTAALGTGPLPEPRADVVFLLDDAPVFAGDPVELAAVVVDEGGRPKPDVAVWVRTPDETEARELRTGADGAVRIIVKDTAQPTSGTLEVDVQVDGRIDRLWIPILPRDLTIAFDPDESRFGQVVGVGEARPVSFKASDADGKPVAREFRWELRRSPFDAPVVGSVTTDAEGKGAFAVTPTKPGAHVVRVWRKEADGIPHSAEAPVTVVEEKDLPPLEIRSASVDLEFGKPVVLSVISRVDKGLAYVSLEGDRLAAPREVTLEKGATALTFDAPPPGVRELRAVVMMTRGSKVHSAERLFSVKEPPLAIEVAKEAGPGEEVELVVRGTPGSEIVVIATPELRVGLRPHAFLRSYREFRSNGAGTADLSFQGVAEELEEALVKHLEEAAEAKPEAPRVMMPTELPKGKAVFDAIGGGGGGGGRFGSRMGGKRNLVARGGGAADKGKPPPAEPAETAPLIFAVLTAGADGRAAAKFRMPHEKTRVDVAAWSLDAGPAIGAAKAEITVKAGITVTARLPRTVLAGEKTTAVAILTNHAKEERTATLRFEGVERAVKVPGRSVVEERFEWTGAPTASLSLDGVARTLTTVVRREGTEMAEAGGAFAAATELAPDGQGKILVRYATGPESLLESLAEGEDPLFPASGAAARLIALVARHRFSPSDATRNAVREFAARRAADLVDAAPGDAAWVPLLYLAAAEAKSAGFEIELDAEVLRERFAQAAPDDVKAIQLLALARGGETQYGYVHRLWRGADALPPRGLAAVALSLKALGKPDEAKEAAGRLSRLAKDDHWEAPAIAASDLSNTPYAATALAAFALAEIEPASPLLPKARAWLLARSPSTASERAFLALAMQSTPDRSRVTALKIGGVERTGFGEVEVDRAAVEPVGQGTYYALARRSTGRPATLPVKAEIAVKRGWPLLRMDGRRLSIAPVTTKEPVENPSMSRVAAGEGFLVTWTLTTAGPFGNPAVLELPAPTGLRIDPRKLRVVVEPQEEAERKRELNAWAYADAPGTYGALEILAPGADYRAGWTMTHAERAAAGARHFEAKRWKEARETLLPLFEKGTLTDAAALQAARTLAYAAAELGESETVVRFFEVLKEKSPDELVSFDKVRAVGKAYAAAKEPERAMQVFAGTCDAYFLQEALLSGSLEELGRARAAADEMRKLLLEHPDTELNRSMRAGFGLRLVSAARGMVDSAEKDPKRLSRSELLAEAIATLERHRSWHPEDPEGDRVALTLGSAYLEAGKPDVAERTARAAAARWPKSRLLDAFDYTLAYAEFAQRKYADALGMCDRLESFDYGPDSNPGPGIMRDRAILMKAQIHHAMGQIDRALENYKKVKETSPDAARSAAFLEREALAVPETTLSPTAKPAEIELEHSGVAEATVKAYRVDLAVLALRRRDLGGAASVEVAGIKPAFEKTFKLDVPNARRREKQRLALDLPKPGAYVVSVKAGDFSAGGLLLRSDLAMSVQDDGAFVRANLTDVKAGGFAEGVKVTIFGTVPGGPILTTRSDLRGIAEGTVSGGRAIVIAEKDGHVAAHRGGLIETPKGQAAMPAQQLERNDDALMEKLKSVNESLEQEFRDNSNRSQRGVEVQRTKK